MWYFPIIPRLKRIFKIQSISEDLRWHVIRRITDGVLRHLTDSQAWHTIDEKFLEIDEDLRNLRLGISADGVDVNTGNRHHSVWPVLTVIYNLHPWLCRKRKFIMLSILISGYLGNDINGKGKRTNNKAFENQEDIRSRGGKIQKHKRNTTEEEGSSSQVKGQNEKNVSKSLAGTLLYVSGKTKDGVNARLDLAELGVKPELFPMQEKDKTTLPLAGYILTNAKKRPFVKHYTTSSKEIILQELDKMQVELVVTLCLLKKFFPLNKPEGCIAEETIAEERIEFF
nr:hypothetical protein [Tanacetum cinerariifolium]